jgi:hypothetical protein
MPRTPLVSTLGPTAAPDDAAPSGSGRPRAGSSYVLSAGPIVQAVAGCTHRISANTAAAALSPGDTAVGRAVTTSGLGHQPGATMPGIATTEPAAGEDPATSPRTVSLKGPAHRIMVILVHDPLTPTSDISRGWMARQWRRTEAAAEHSRRSPPPRAPAMLTPAALISRHRRFPADTPTTHFRCLLSTSQ